jgi:hypothetical protein
MWISALFGMVTKYSEIVLSLKYRETNEEGAYMGGPMYYIKNGLGKKWGWLAAMFALFAMIACIGTGNATSVLELVNSFERVNELKLNYKVAPRRPGDVVSIWADTSLANEELGWKAERPLDDTLQAAWAWEKSVRGIE